MRLKKQKNFSHSITVLLILTNFLLFILLILVCYIAVESKRVFQKKLSSLDQKVEKNLGSLSHLADVSENLADLSQIGKKINTEAIKEEIAELTVNISKLGNLEDIKKKLGELGKEFSQELRSDLSSLNNLADSLQEVKNNLKSLGEISLQLKNLSNLEGIKDNLDNLESIKNDISKIKMPEGSKELEAIKEKLAGLEKEGQILVNEFSRSVDSIICSKCHRQKVILSAPLISQPDLIVKKEDWKEWVKERGLILKYEDKNRPMIPGSFPGLGPFENLDLRVGNIPPEVREETNRVNYEIKLDSYLCPGCKRKIEELEGLEDYKDDLPKLIKELKI